MLLNLFALPVGAQTGPVPGTVRESGGSVSLLLGVARSDNIERLPPPTRSGSYRILGITSDYSYVSERIALQIAADIERRMYSAGNIDDETYGDGALELEVHAIPERFSWLFENTFRQGRLDPFAPSAPGNRAELTEVSTGPRVQLPLGERTSLQMQALKSHRSGSEAEDLDGDTDEALVSLFRTLDSTTEIGLNFAEQDINYETAASEYEITNSYFSYSKSLATGEARLSVGRSTSQSGLVSSSAPYLNLYWSRRLTARSVFSINATQGYSDSFEEGGLTGGGNAILSRDLYERQGVSLEYSIDGTRNSISVELSLSEADYASDSENDSGESSVSVVYRRTISPVTGFSVQSLTRKREFDSGMRADRTIDWVLGVDRRFSQRIYGELNYEISELSAVIGGNTKENTIRARFRYVLAGSG